LDTVPAGGDGIVVGFHPDGDPDPFGVFRDCGEVVVPPSACHQVWDVGLGQSVDHLPGGRSVRGLGGEVELPERTA
jgi:hypothetical protein